MMRHVLISEAIVTKLAYNVLRHTAIQVASNWAFQETEAFCVRHYTFVPKKAIFQQPLLGKELLLYYINVSFWPSFPLQFLTPRKFQIRWC